jgi:hypothetical protein
MEHALDEAGFWDILEKRFVESGKTKKDFLIAVKPNLMMLYSRDDMSPITEPVLVEHLIIKIVEKGYTNIALVESQNVYGNWFKNREVENVARYAGYSATNYNIVDLTLDTVAHTYKGPLGTYLVGKTWRDADFRIFLMLLYHDIKEYLWYNAMLKEFPVHFGIVIRRFVLRILKFLSLYK